MKFLNSHIHEDYFKNKEIYSRKFYCLSNLRYLIRYKFYRNVFLKIGSK